MTSAGRRTYVVLLWIFDTFSRVFRRRLPRRRRARARFASLTYGAIIIALLTFIAGSRSFPLDRRRPMARRLRDVRTGDVSLETSGPFYLFIYLFILFI